MERRGGWERLRTHQDVVGQIARVKGESRIPGDKAVLLSIQSLTLALSYSSEGMNKHK